MSLPRRLLLTLPALLAATTARAQTVMQLTTTAVNDLDVEWLRLFKTNIEAASGGKLRANVYPASQLGSGPTTVEGLAMGTIEVALNASGTYEALEPGFAVLAMPGLIDSMAQGARLLADPRVRKQLDPIGRDKGVELLTVLAHSPVGIVSRHPIERLDDLRGMKIRVPGSKLLLDQLKQLGAAPIAMSLGEVLPAFQNGTIDGVYAGTTIFSALKYYDISKNMTLLPSTYIVILGLANSAFVASLGPLATAMHEAAHKADVEGAKWGETDVANAKTLWQKNGGKIIELPPEDGKRYLDTVVPVAFKALNPTAQAAYTAIKAVAASLH